jgi:hypothetical protein
LKDVLVDGNERVMRMIRANEVIRFRTRVLPISIVYLSGVSTRELLLIVEDLIVGLQNEATYLTHAHRMPYNDGVRSLREFKAHLRSLVEGVEAAEEAIPLVVQSPLAQ